jgi:Glyoxalase-like domain
MQRMAPIARLGAVSLDTSDPASLSAFYRELLDLEVFFESDDFIVLKGAAILVGLQRVEAHQPPDWPSTGTPKQLHLELAVTDLDTAEAAALAIGATRPDTQPSPDLWRVLVDPAGHPFCITTLIPEV